MHTWPCCHGGVFDCVSGGCFFCVVWSGVPGTDCFLQFSSASVVDCCLYWFLGVAGFLLSSQCDTACTTALDMTAGKQTPVHVATPCLKVDLSRIELLPELS